MKKIYIAAFTVIIFFCFFVSLTHAYPLITDYSNYPAYGCTGPSTNCQVCHLAKYNNNTTWHTDHKTNADSICATCHTGPANGCYMGAVPTSSCATCHASLPCDWVDNHMTANRGVNCSTGSCHGDCATVIELSSFTAVPDNRKVVIEWTTETEINNAGFNLYRSESVDGAYVKINPDLIPAKGAGTSGASYQYEDNNVKNRNTYCYKLEDLDTSGISTMHGPAVATPRRVGVR
ncbi:MAG TPA: hypothetical protein VMX95_04525 [Thermodesulfobacteriota bacterium]|nr:hypothetical protein [Thermodesulfobacteriota bacterium]